MGKETVSIEVTLTHNQDVPKGKYCRKEVVFCEGRERDDVGIEPCERLDGEMCTIFWLPLEIEKRKNIKSFEYTKKCDGCINSEVGKK